MPQSTQSAPVPMSAAHALHFVGPNAKKARLLEKALVALLKRLEPSEATKDHRAQVFEYFSTVLRRIDASCLPYVIEHPSLDISMPDGDIRVGVYVTPQKVRDLFYRCTNTLLLRSQMTKPGYYLKAIAAATYGARSATSNSFDQKDSYRSSHTEPRGAAPATQHAHSRRVSRSEPILTPTLARTATPTPGAAWGDGSRTSSLLQSLSTGQDKPTAPTTPVLPSFPVSSVTVIDSLARVLHCAIGDTTLTLTSNTSVPLARLCFTQVFAAATTVADLYTSSLLLLRLWGFLEARVLCLDEQRQGLRAGALEVMLLMTINCYVDVFQQHKYDSRTGIPADAATDAGNARAVPEKSQLDWCAVEEVAEKPIVATTSTALPIPLSPLLVLHTFFSVFAYFDFSKYCVTSAGPLAISAFRHALVKHKNVPRPDLPPAWGVVTLSYPTAEAPCSRACVPAPVMQLLADEYGLLASKKAGEASAEQKAGATPSGEASFASAERILGQVEQLRAAPSAASPEAVAVPEPRTVSWTCPTTSMFHFGPANIVDFVDPCCNLGSSLTEDELAAVKGSFHTGLRALNKALSNPNMDASGILKCLFPSMYESHAQVMQDVEATLKTDAAAAAEQPAYNASVEIAKVQRQLLRVREFVRSQVNMNKK